ncbi:NADH dehydrogenase [ubiquinone] 1 beta subcomplex subunit 10-A [Olea europaea subsp. europaea]|uniref:NADH dehydrogenase [ubiquinone] 1 beta subcomplex subunit 10-A n=1 Tax=Olea europaea subsp. europaea TaxID=158383 RepID=A0A8S0P716_OLEEU|nr:NADH dehydrogenase [ubiquinone] 1 beta subcomplex subunit 10-A [Olea europaea subsp. europaea]
MASSDPSKRPRPGQPDSQCHRLPVPNAPDSAPNSLERLMEVTLAKIHSYLKFNPSPKNPNLTPNPCQAKPSLPTSTREPGSFKPPGDKEQMPPLRKRRNSDGGRNLGSNGLPAAAGEGSRRALRDEEVYAPIDVLPQTGG